MSDHAFVLRLLGDEEVGNKALTPFEREQLRLAAAEIARLRALVDIGDELVKSIRDHDLDGAVLRQWEEARHG